MEDNLVRLGGSLVDISKLVRDVRGVGHLIKEAIAEDWQENRFAQFQARLYPFPEAADIAEWDQFLLERYDTVYTSPQTTCQDCPLGPCLLTAAAGRCGLPRDTYQARLSLRRACRGCFTQMADSREVLNFALKRFGPEHNAEMGPLQDRSDYTAIGVLTGQYLRTLNDLDIALSYGEAQLARLLAASYTATGPAREIEAMALHAGSLLFLAMEVAEMTKMACFDFTNAARQDIAALIDYPTASTPAGMATLERDKPAIVFAGDSCLSAWCAVNLVKERGWSEQVEIAGIGPAGHDLIRYYDRARLLGPMTQGAKIVRAGLADVLVASSACLPLDLAGEARRAGATLLWTSSQPIADLPDRTDDPVEQIIADLVAGAPGAIIRSPQQAAEVALGVARQTKRSHRPLLAEEQAVAEARRCREDCDLCFRVCPNSLPVGSATRSLVTEGYAALAQVEQGCFFCHRCQEACPEQIPLLDMIAATLAQRIPQDKYIMRAGRGSTSRNESSSYAFGSMWGNCPGKLYIAGCGDAKYLEDLTWIAREMVSRNCLVWVAGCAGAEVARHFSPEEGKYLYQLFTAEAQPRNLMNCGGCSAHVHMLDESQKYSRTGSAISHYANYAETAERMFNLFPQVLIIWGALPERMYAIAAGFARAGVPVIVGPASGFAFNRYLLSNKWDWERWFVFDTWGGRKRFVEPTPKHLIIPVETKEEAVTLSASLMMRTTDLRDSRQIRLETYTEFHEKFYGSLPDDIHYFISSDWELPLRYKGRLLRHLQEKQGWQIQRMKILKAKHPDGRLMPLEQFDREYSARTKHVVYIPRLISKIPTAEAKR